MKKVFSGMLDDRGVLKIKGTESFKQFLKELGSGEVLISIEKPDPKTSLFMIRYFETVIVQEFNKIFIKTWGEHLMKEVIIQRLLSWSPFARDSEGNERKVSDLTKQEMIAFIEHCKNIAMMEFETYIE